VPYTFGSATSSSVSWPHGPTIGATATALFVAGWWRPTTLTATRALWGFGATLGAEIDTTTDELRLRTDTTTDGQQTTTGVDLVVDEWKFLAFFASFLNSGSASVWKVWAGDITNPPTAKTVAVAVASSGNFTGSTTFFVGNKSGATIAFQGDIANIECSVTGASAVVGVTTHPFGIAAYGALTAAEEQHILETFVWPAWQGQTRFAESRNISVGDNAGMFRWFNPLDLRGELIGFGSATFIMPTVRTIANIGETAIGCPRPAVTTPLTPYRRR
jgi:hypothetical protein